MEYLPGDFSFKQSEYNYIFEYDYRIINKIGVIAWDNLKTDKLDCIFDIIQSQLYPGHSARTYRLSLNNLKFIATNGWDNFVKMK